MTWLEIVCVVVVITWLVLRLWHEPSRRALLQQMLFISVAAFVSEDSCIRIYGIYFYSPDRWSLFVDQVPLLILLIWPVVMTSALQLAGALQVQTRRLPLLLSVLVVADAWFIEPIAVNARLWSWTLPGPFAVPPIGVLGWGCFAAGIGVVVARRWPAWAVVLSGPLACHALVLVLWWGALRWVPSGAAAFTDDVATVAVWVITVAVVTLIAKERPAGLRSLVLLRVPAALFFFGLLGLNASTVQDRDLLCWSLAFAPPWLALTVFSRASSSAPGSNAGAVRS